MGFTDEDIKLWIRYDEGLYEWWKATQKATQMDLHTFVDENREALSEAIRRAQWRTQSLYPPKWKELRGF